MCHRGVSDLAVASVVLLQGPDRDDDTHFPLCELGSGQKTCNSLCFGSF